MKEDFHPMRKISIAPFLSKISLKARIVSLFLLAVIITFIGVGTISFMTISDLIRNKVDAGYINALHQMIGTVEELIKNLDSVSQQFALTRTVLDKIEAYLGNSTSYEKVEISNNIVDSLTSVTFTNPNIGLIYYYIEDTDEILFNTYPVGPRAHPLEDMDLLTEFYQSQYLGPSNSKNSFTGRKVLAVVRKVSIAPYENAYLYVESGYRIVENIFDNRRSNGSLLLFLNTEGVVTYSELPEQFPVGTVFDYSEGVFEYRVFTETANQGWRLVSLVPVSLYHGEWWNWLTKIILLCMALTALCSLLAVLMWKNVYRPLKQFDLEIDLFLEQAEGIPPVKTHIREYDYLLDRMGYMRGEIQQMIKEITRQQQHQSQLELEKLRYQINPHFLMNTLNTIHWLAVMRSENEIDDITQSLNRLLLYNLNNGDYTTLEEEISAILDYIHLQQSRYGFTFELVRNPDGHIFHYACPRFFLQPIVENALYHGYRDSMSITMTLILGETLTIIIEDNGIGMDEVTLTRLKQRFIHPEQHDVDNNRQGMGIGIGYVVRTLRAAYGDSAVFSAESEQGKGTRIAIEIPISIPNNRKDLEDEDSDRG